MPAKTEYNLYNSVTYITQCPKYILEFSLQDMDTLIGSLVSFLANRIEKYLLGTFPFWII